MSNKSADILVIFFNRPDIFRRQLIALKEFKPSSLYFAADGPRLLNKEDWDRINQCKELITKIIDWTCGLHFYYSEKNYGCDQFVPIAIDWFFSNVDSGIILEDDCLISSEFYGFASLLLERYATDEQIMNISAPNFQLQKWGSADYYFSKYPSNWGWATWRRAWVKFNSELQDFERFVERGGTFDQLQLKPSEKRYWLRFFHGLIKGKYTFWDAKWVYAVWKSGGISITPNVNLSSNIGFGSNATHTKVKETGHDLTIGQLRYPISHPIKIMIAHSADNYLFNTRYKPTILGKVRSALTWFSNFLGRHGK